MNMITKGLRNRILKMGLIPVLVLTFSFGILGTVLTTDQIKSNFEQHIKASSLLTALHIKSILHTDSRELLEEETRMSLKQRGLDSLRITDMSGKVVQQAGPPFVTEINTPPKIRPSFLVTDKTVVTTSFIDTGPGYWLELEFCSDTPLVEIYQWLLLCTATTAVALLIATVFSLRLANSLTAPLSRIVNSINQISMGDLSVRLPSETQPEMNLLAHYINTFLEKMQHNYRDMQNEIELTSKELQENMETLELQNAELDLSRKMALEASNTKSEFLANMSHEMRTPLNSISGYTSLLQRSNLNDIQKEHLRTLSMAANTLQSIIDDILDFAKLEAGKLVLEEAPMDLRTVVDDVLAMNSPAAENKDLELAVLCYPDTPLNLIGDANRLKQVISNLLSNAIKFTNEGAIIIRVMCENQRAPYATLRISVEDTGIGISRENSHKLFQAFSQVDSSRNRHSTGTGLGLVICKNLVKQMHGSIDFDSEPGKGSRFWFTFRAPLDHHYSPPQPQLKTPEKALLLEPGKWTQVSVSQLLQEHGFSVDIFSEPEELTAYLNKCQTPVFTVIGHDPDTIPEQVIEKILVQSPDDSCTLILSSTGYMGEFNHLRSKALTVLPRPLSRARVTEILEKLYSTAEESSTQQGSTVMTAAGSLKVLAVDDNEPNLKLLTTMIKDMGIQIDTASCGKNALKLIKSHDYDLVFMDIQMPEMDGLEVTRRIRKRETGSHHLPIIALTAHALADEKKQLLAAGMDDYLTKPISDQQLRHVISRWSHSGELPIPSPKLSVITPTHSTATKIHGPVDKDEGVRLAGGRKELAEELLDMLLRDLEDNARELRMLHHQQQFVHLLEAVHKLHGATRYCGVPQLRQSCQELEVLLKQTESLEESNEAFEELIAEINRLLVWQERFSFEELA